MSGWYPGKNVERFMQRRKEESSSSTEKPEAGKEGYYLKFNKDEIFKNLIAAEGHFRNIADKGEEAMAAGYANCVVKHYADAESHADEAISHSAVVEGDESSRLFQDLRDGIKDARWKLQKGGINPFEGIKEARNLRRKFESFNREYDISKCKACEPVEVLMKKAMETQKHCAAAELATE